MPHRPTITHGNQIAAYSASIDTVMMPNRNQFHRVEGYYSTLFHELVHSTGHRNRLHRPAVHDINFGSEKYSKEELIAEIGAAFLCGHTGIENQKTLENTSAYVKSWVEKLENDKKLIVTAASAAQKAVDYIVGEQEV